MADINGKDTEEKLKNSGKLQPFNKALYASGAKLLNVLPLGLDEVDKKDMAKAMIYLTMKAYDEVPKLRECTPDSIINSLMDCATLGMMPFSKMNECTILSYGNKASMQLMYRGIEKLCRNTGEYKNIRTGVVREGDKIEYYKGLKQDLRHFESDEPAHNRNITHVYALYELINGGSDFEIMKIEDIREHRDKYSKQYRYAKRKKEIESSVWYKDEEGMARKTVLIKVLKFAPKSDKLIKQLALDRDLKREIAPESKDFTKEKEDEFIKQRNADATGIYKDETKSKETSKKTKVKAEKVGENIEEDIFDGEIDLLVNQKDIAGFYARLTELGIKKEVQEKISNRIKEKYSVKSKKELTVVQLREALNLVEDKIKAREKEKNGK